MSDDRYDLAVTIADWPVNWRDYLPRADELIAAGWQRVPAGHVVVPTEGPGFEAMVEMAAKAVWETWSRRVEAENTPWAALGDDWKSQITEEATAALRAALTPEET